MRIFRIFVVFTATTSGDGDWFGDPLLPQSAAYSGMYGFNRHLNSELFGGLVPDEGSVGLARTPARQRDGPSVTR